MKKKLQFQFLVLSILSLSSLAVYADSGGPLSPEQAAYNVNYYDLDLIIDPVTKTINGSLLCRVEIVNPIDTLVLDLDNRFFVSSVLCKINDESFSNVTANQSNGQVFISIPGTVIAGDFVTAQIYYGGAPQVAVDPPWGVGFVWDTRTNGEPWIGVACEDQGGDIWWPCKDHPSDEPDSMSMSFTVPKPLVCVSNGRFMGSTNNGDTTTTYDWFISTPINNYNVTFYAAEYALIEDEYSSVSGDTIPFYFAVLPEDSTTAANYMDVFLEEFDFLESICGPFPFGTDKHGWAHAPYWGMEHQTIIAYGHDFTTNSWGYDYIHYHELAHEWWGNLITAKDWADVWIHEGIATYTEALYVEHLHGKDGYHQFLSNPPWDFHDYPLAPFEALTASEAFDNLNPYRRGAYVMHTLRYHLGDEVFFNLLERWAYPDSTDFDNTNGRLCRILTTEDLKIQSEEETGIELDPFFDVFFREASYPVLKVVRHDANTTFSWETENNVPLDLNIPVRINGIDQTVEMTEGEGDIAIAFTDELVIDPKQWILMADPSIVVSVSDGLAQNVKFGLEQNYPNPFAQNTTISVSIPKSENISLKVYDMFGNQIATLFEGEKEPGKHEFVFDGNQLPNGYYFYRLWAGDFTETRKMILIR